jgi:hypothetical protein
MNELFKTQILMNEWLDELIKRHKHYIILTDEWTGSGESGSSLKSLG